MELYWSRLYKLWLEGFIPIQHSRHNRVYHETCTYSYICTSSICLESCVHAEEILHIWPVPKLSHNATKYTVHRTHRGNSAIWGASGVKTEVNEGYTWKYIDRKWNIESTQEVITFNQLEGKWEKTNHPNTTAVPGCVYLFCLRTYWFAARPVALWTLICVYPYLYSTVKDDTVRLQ